MPISGNTNNSNQSGNTPVRIASNGANINIATGLTAGTIIQGYTLLAGDLVLLKDQTLPIENGIYTVPTTGSASRDSTLDISSDAVGRSFFIRSGANAGVTFNQISSPAIVGTNNLSFVLNNQGLLSSSGTNTITVQDGQTITTATYSDIVGSNFTFPNAGKHIVTYEVASNNNVGGAIVQVQCTNNLGVFVPNSFSSYMQVTGATITSPLKKTFFVTTTTSNETYKLQCNNTALSTTTIRNNTTINLNTSGQSTVTWEQISSNLGISSVVGAMQGEIRPFAETASFGDWIICQGQAITTLTPAQQTVAIAKGYTTSLPDMRNRSIVGSGLTFPYLSTGGTNNIAQNNLPNVQLPLKTSVANSGLWYRSSPDLSLRLSNPSGQIYDASTMNYNQAYSDLNGNVTQQLFMTPYIAMNYFVWLGASVTTATTQFPFNITTIGTGASTWNPATGTLNIPISGGTAPIVRILTNPGGTTYTQAQLQGYYDGQTGSQAPDIIPIEVVNYANSLNTPNYKVYLGHNTWYYTNTATGITQGNWTPFGGGGKSTFGANIVATGILTFK